MLAQSSTLLARPPSQVVALLTAPDQQWVVELDGDGRDQLARAGVRVGRIPVYKRVELTVGKPPTASHSERLMLPVQWRATGGPPMFPRLEGTLHVQPQGPKTTRLTLNATYDPPFGSLGQLIDRALMHRLAEATLKDFLDRLAARVLAGTQGRDGEGSLALRGRRERRRPVTPQE